MLLFPYRPSLLEPVPLGIVGASRFAATALRTHPVEIPHHIDTHLPVPFAKYSSNPHFARLARCD
jgi:hypothetical protein